MHYVYVIYSLSADRYYIGETVDIQVRIHQHNTHFFKGAFTTIASDWKLAVLFTCSDRPAALKVEKHLKQMKSKQYLTRLHNDIAAQEKLKLIIRDIYGIDVQ